MSIVHRLSELPSRALVSGRTGEAYSVVRSLSEAAGLQQLLVHQEVLQPGQRALAPHCHSHKEELVLVLAGVATVFWGEQRWQVQAGEFIGLKPGPELHVLVNESDAELVYLTVGVAHPQDQIRFAPETPPEGNQSDSSPQTSASS